MNTYRRVWLAWLLAALALLAATVTLAQSGQTDDQRIKIEDLKTETTIPSVAQSSGISLESVLPVEPALLKSALTDPEQPLEFIVYLRDKADLSKWEQPDHPPRAATPAEAKARLVARRTEVVNTLKTTADQSQAGLLADLAARQSKGQVKAVQPLWVVNAVGVQADGATLLDLAARPDIAMIRANHTWTMEAFDPAPAAMSEQLAAIAQWHIQRIRADAVWSLLGLDGTGVVVANMDTGVDWQHPDLQTRYRGYDPRGLPNHRGNWFCATDEGYLYPGDGNGHGTHTMGLMVGQRGIGAAPGATWIAVKTFNDNRLTTDMWIQAAFQWLLAPGGDPALAPDIVNGSWSSAARDSQVYREPIRALRAAGILPVFSAGNDGPTSQTVGVPGGYPEALTVGATDAENNLAVFSGRGPSFFATIKPDVVAPGVTVLSTYHGGGYAIIDGTSMSTPLVAGIAALIRQAQPDISPDQIAQLIRQTARPIGTDPLPNNKVGAGLADAYAALSYLTGAGEIVGRVTRVGDGGPVRGAEVTVTALASGGSIRLTTDATGAYTVPVQAGVYEVTVRAFGYAELRRRGVSVAENEQVRIDFQMTLLPVGAVLGRVTSTTGAPLPATVIVEDTPVTTTAQVGTGAYSLALPPGAYRLRVEQRGQRIGRAHITISQPGAAVEQNFALPPAPTILLVDTGGWYSSGTGAYYRDALAARDFLHDTHTVIAVQNSGLTLQQLRRYDLILWSSPEDAPRLVGADRLLADYLRQGGQLIISGQDIAYWDGGGTSTITEYFRTMLNARFVTDNAATNTVRGVGPFQGVTWALNGADSADNQFTLDVVEAVKPENSTVVALYPPDRRAGFLVTTCVPHRALYLSFGIEGVSGLQARADLLEQAIALVTETPPTRALTTFTPSPAEVAAAGEVVTYTLRLRNIGSLGDEYTLRVADARWPTQIIDPASNQPIQSLSLDPCLTRDVLVRVQVPTSLSWNEQDTAAIQIASRADSAISQTVRLVSKTPSPVLLVDDDQFVNVQDVYTRALQLGGLPYDVWDSGQVGTQGRGSPPLARLSLYPVVVWFTGYDFLDNLSAADEARLATYLNTGGRLLLSSQDYLFTSGRNRFALDYLGVLAHTEDQTTSELIGVPGDPIGDGLGPFALDFAGVLGSARYNHSDALTPTALARAAFIGSHGRPVGLRLDQGRFRTAFFGLPLETLGPTNLAPVLQRLLGWLGPLGASQVSADKSIVAAGDSVTFSIDARNNGTTRRDHVRLENPLPPHTTLIPDSLIGATLEEGKIVWAGALAPGGVHGVRYRVTITPDLPPATDIVNRARLIDESGLASDIFTRVRVNVPDLSPSVAVVDKTQVYAGDVVNVTLSLRNRGALDATGVLTATLPLDLALVQDSVGASSGTVSVQGGQVRWMGVIGRAGVPVVIAFQVRVAPGYLGGPLPLTITLADGYNPPLDRSVTLGATRQLFLPLIEKRAQP